jgi:CheY-like chemotaxis protein
MMPKMDGVEAMQKLRKRGYEGIIVMFTANALIGNAEMFLGNGFDAFISKPIDTQELDDILMKFIHGRTPVGQLVKKMTALDVMRGMTRFDNQLDVYLKILRAFITSLRTALDEIKVVTKESLESYKITVHGIKGASFDIYANALGEMAKALEHASESGDFAFVEAHHAALLEAGYAIIADYESIAEHLAPPKPKKDKPDAELLSALREACDAFDVRVVDDIMAQLGMYKYEQDDALIDELFQHGEAMNYECMVELIDNR